MSERKKIGKDIILLDYRDVAKGEEWWKPLKLEKKRLFLKENANV